MKAVLYVSFLLYVASYLVTPIMDPDLWWHINAGRWMLAHQEIPHVDIWTRFGSGLPWRAYSWSNEIVLAATDIYFGITGLLALKGLLAAAIVASFALLFWTLSGSYFVSALLTAFSVFGLSGHYTLRPQSVTWVLFALLLFFASKINRDASSVLRIFLRSLPIAIIMCVWANTHLSAVLALAALFFWLMPRRISDFRYSITVVTLAFLGTLATPYFGGEWLTLLEKTSHPSHFSRIAEFSPATILQFHTGFLLLSVALVAWTIVEDRSRLSAGKLLGGAFFTLLGLAIIKFIPLAILYNCALIAYALGRGSPMRFAESLSRLFQVIQKIPREGLSFILLCAMIVNVYSAFQKPLASRIPKRTLDFVIEKQLPLPLLNTFNQGGYIAYRLANVRGEPSAKVAIDGRTNLIPSDIWQHYTASMYGYENWRTFVNRVAPNTVLWNLTSPLVALLKETGEWCEVFREGLGEEATVTLVKRGSFAACQ